MRSVTVTLHQHSDGSYAMNASLYEDGAGLRQICKEESHRMPEVVLSDAWGVAAQIAGEALRAEEPGPGLWSV